MSWRHTKDDRRIRNREANRLRWNGAGFSGEHTRLGRAVAIKLIASHRRWDQTMQDRFASEMKTIGSLNHPNIVVAHDAREVDGVAVLVTEFIDGMDVSEILKRNGTERYPSRTHVRSSVRSAMPSITLRHKTWFTVISSLPIS